MSHWNQEYDDVPLVSVIMAAYNCGDYIGSAIESVLGQTYPNIELHVVDDASTDHTAAEVRKFLADTRLHYYRLEQNSGQTIAKNHGIRMSHGAFIAFCDADDMWLPDKLAVQVPALRANPGIGVVYTRYMTMDQHGNIQPHLSATHHCKSGRVTRELFKTNFVSFGTAMVRRHCLEELGLFNERYRMGIDWDLWLRISTRYEFLFLNEVTYMYRTWTGQMSSNWQGRYEYAFRIMDDFVTRYPGLLDPATVNEAWADSYTNRARLRCLLAREYGNALLDIARALGRKPGYVLAWRSIAFVLLHLFGLRKSLQQQRQAG